MNENIHFVKFVILSLAWNGRVSDVYFVYFFLPLLVLTQPEDLGEGTMVSYLFLPGSGDRPALCPLFPFLKVRGHPQFSAPRIGVNSALPIASEESSFLES